MIILYFLCVATSGYAVFPDVPDVVSLSMGRVRALSQTAVNPSSLSFLEKGKAGFAVMNHYQIKELHSFSAYGLFPNKYLDAAVRLSQFGLEDYREWAVQAGVSKKVHPACAIGASLHYQRSTGAYEDDPPSATGVDLGVSFLPASDLRCVLLCENVVNNAGGRQGLFSLGIDYRIVPACRLLAEYATNAGDVARFSFGIEYELMDAFFVRTGCYTQEFTPTFGLSFAWNGLTADLACDRHAHLGYSTSLGLSYLF